MVVVTGAAGGIGASVAARLEQAGYFVLGTDRVGTVDLQADISADDGLAQLGDAINSRIAQGHILHGLVNVAGILRSGQLLDLSVDDWDAMHAVNTRSVFRTTQLVARLMVRQQEHEAGNSRGIVTISSNAGTTPRYNLGGYCASKSAATMTTRCFSIELAKHGIRANIVSPGSTRTEMLRALNGSEDTAKQSVLGDPANFRHPILLGRIADPEDIADSVEFLLSPRAKHLTGAELVVDGGATLP
ncbi:2,3-dihydro-2,3-dihydroxybenzoate dehydrogenase [Glutamicibacter uratoxydans]|uniref:2,3-dihydro-2,3-dihydroxybenzoate dehydrogenase n=1 Tax=Glutamicibacter uratoxydans TaxID=43667 RepID=A0A4Y4DIW9_GLUUR|nr:2,3-dihydro-2,3-dihydroxybenzoate dehydrogenase [Glutamicibacter uratoxydans]